MLFNDQNVDLAIIEAGIGGEHDSTAKLNHQQLVVLTSVSKDHTKILGHNLNDIIRTKIGIIHHPSTPLVVAPSNLCHQNLITQVHTKTIFAQPNHAVVLTFKNNLFLQDNLSTVLAVISYLK